MGKIREACGRCSMSSVVDAVGDDGELPNPFEGDRIEVPEEEMRKAAKVHVWASTVKSRLNEFARRVTYAK